MSSEGIYGREPAPQQRNAAMQQLQARFCRYRWLVDGRSGARDLSMFIQDEKRVDADAMKLD
jgi:hypothetical protein